jgi:hypothetical protein
MANGLSDVSLTKMGEIASIVAVMFMGCLFDDLRFLLEWCTFFDSISNVIAGIDA